MRLRLLLPAAALLAAGFLIPLQSADDAANSKAFDQNVRPLLTGTCSQCHSDKVASGGFRTSQVLNLQSLTANRDTWTAVLRRLRAGEMPPPGISKPPPEQITSLINYVQGQFDLADRNTPADPGRVVAHRLNRNEYTNTIRDLLAVDFRADKNFPADDSSGGFDNISDVLTVSPVLMEKYISAAEQIAARAIGADPLPKPIEIEYANKDRRVRRIDPSTIEATHRVDFDADYDIRFALPGERAADAKPVMFGFWMDGKLLKSQLVETKPSGLIYFNPYSEEKMHVYLPAGDHVFRAGFIEDEFIKTLDSKDVYNNKKNKFVDSIIFTGPFASNVEKPSQKLILVCDPNTGRVCAEKIVSTLARRAYRRPVTTRDVAQLMRFVDLAVADKQSIQQGLQLAIQAMLVSPNFLYRIERDPNAKAHKVTDVELASRLSYFLWSSMPDEELQTLAESGKLSTPANLDAQIKRLLADPKSAAFAANFAGQWLETRNLDTWKPDPGKFPQWNAELRDAMKEETRLFFDHILRDNRPISDFLSADYTYLNERLAKHYGIEGVKGSEFRQVALSTDPNGSAQRGGVLSQASVLTVSSYPNRTSPVIRGKYVLNNILGTPPPPPPPDVPRLNEDEVGKLGSMREQLEMHRANPVCASCHSKMDPLGFGLENYDAIGRWRSADGKFPIDSTGLLPNGKTFSTPAEMRAVLTSLLPEFSRALTERMLTYALGRGLKSYDDRAIDTINQTVAKDGYKFQTIIYEIAHSLPFQSRRSEESVKAEVLKPEALKAAAK